ncbi:MAG TPA: spore germination protein, partial [Bacillota bacterium]|nr:spore germination protein [Bacillota bacterium]
MLETLVQGLADAFEWNPVAPLPRSVDQWVTRIRGALGSSSDVIARQFTAGRSRQRAVVVYLDGMVDTRMVDQDIIAQLQQAPAALDGGFAVDAFLAVSSVEVSADLSKIIDGILSGHAALFCHGNPCTYIVDARGYKARSPEQPTTERTILGSKEAFVEPLRTNTTMIRRRIQSRHLQMVELRVGDLSPAAVAVVYLGNIARPSLVKAILSRLRAIRADSVLTSAALAAHLQGDQASPFPQVERTERPEVVSQEVLNGRVCVLLENDPFAILLPTTFWDMLQAHGDYTQSAWGATFVRSVRAAALFFVATGPGLYCALVMVHLDLIPHDLALTIVAGRQGLPVPAPLEYAFLILLFEILREVSIRIPQSLGPTIGVVGGIVLGQAVVQSGIASAPLIVVVSLVGLSLFTAPHYQLVVSNRYV